MAQDTALIVDHVAVAAADPLGLLDDAVEALSAGIGGVLAEGDQDGRPPRLDGFGQPGRLGQLGVDRGLVEVGQPPPSWMAPTRRAAGGAVPSRPRRRKSRWSDHDHRASG